MIGRFLYHLFWNFYDYLGTYVLLGFLAVTVLLAGAWGALYVASIPGVPAPVPLAAACVVLLLLVAPLAAGYSAFATVAARDGAARLRHFKEGLVADWRRYLVLTILLSVVMVIVGANIAFYLHFAGRSSSAVLRLTLICLAMIFAWLGLTILCYLFPAAGSLSRMGEDSPQRLATAMRRALVVFVLCPVSWCMVAVLSLCVSVLLALTIVGSVFIPALLATASCTGFAITSTYARHLAAAKQELGPDRPISAYRRRARELYAEDDARQHFRGLRELIRPWDV